MNVQNSIEIYVCSDCNRVHSKRNEYCYYCNSSLLMKEISKIGILYSFTKVPREKIEGKEDQLLVLVEMDGGLKILGELKNNFLDSVSIGMKMEIVSIDDKKLIFTLLDGV